MFLNNEEVTKKNQKGNLKNPRNKITMKTQLKSYGMQQSQF